MSALRQFGREGTALGSRSRRAFDSRRRCLKIALRGENQDRCRRDQEQIVGQLGSRAGHHIAVRRACCRRRAAAQPSNSRRRQPGRPACSGRPGRAAARRASGERRSPGRWRRRIAAAVSFAVIDLAGPERIGRDRDAQAAGERGELRWRAAKLCRGEAGADRSNRQQQRADGAERPKQAVLDFDPAKQRHDADQAGGDQENPGGREQSRSNRIGSDRAGRLIGPVAQVRPRRPLDLVELQPQPGAQQVARRREHVRSSTGGT